jgi:hypothetical protein
MNISYPNQNMSLEKKKTGLGIKNVKISEFASHFSNFLSVCQNVPSSAYKEKEAQRKKEQR